MFMMLSTLWIANVALLLVAAFCFSCFSLTRSNNACKSESFLGSNPVPLMNSVGWLSGQLQSHTL